MSRPTGLRLAPIDGWTAAYAVVAAAVTLRRQPPDLAPLLVGHALLAGLALLAPHARASGRLGRLLGEFYPLLVCHSLYSAVGLLNRSGGISHDELILRAEAAVFGTQPSLAWIRSQPWAPLSWLMHSAYLAKYPMLVAAPLALWRSGRLVAARSVLLTTMVTFYVCYLAFLVFPVAGPRFLFPLPSNAATDTAPALLAHWLLEAGSAWGTAFPSSHVAVTLVTSVTTFRLWPRLGRPLMAVALVLAPATVYCQFHYALDAIAGAAVGVVVLVLWRHPYEAGEGDAERRAGRGQQQRRAA